MVVDALKVFVTVIEHNNFSRAAEELYISQPAVSMQIRNLENELGTKLMYRTSKNLLLTQSGEILYAKAKQILNYYEEAKHQINLLKEEVGGILRIGASFTIGEYVLPGILGDYIKQHPNVNIEVTIANSEDIIKGVKDTIDIGLIEGPINSEDLTRMSFVDDEMILIVPNDHPLAKSQCVWETDNSYLHDHTWVLREKGSGTRSFTDEFIQDLGLRIKQSSIFGSNQGVKEAVINGLGIAIVSSLIVKKELEQEEISAIKLGEKSVRSFSIVQRSNLLESKAMRILLESLKAYSI